MKLAVIGLILCLNFSSSVFAQSNIFDFESIIGPFPAVGSAAEKKDVEELLYYQNTRTKEQCDAAQAEADASLEVFFGGKNGLLNEHEVANMNKKLRWVTAKAGIKILYYKTKYGRARPYDVHPEIKPCIELENSKSYPSGHTTLARVYGKILSVVYPERALQIMNRADEVAMHRVLGGVHHPSDIVAGKKLGDAIAQDYLEDGDNFYNLLESNN